MNVKGKYLFRFSNYIYPALGQAKLESLKNHELARGYLCFRQKFAIYSVGIFKPELPLSGLNASYQERGEVGETIWKLCLVAISPPGSSDDYTNEANQYHQQITDKTERGSCFTVKACVAPLDIIGMIQGIGKSKKPKEIY